ncbi:MAG: GIY-YIG nuclease family protein [Planctomycetes bacterium]|nr:GIY-YIG nuclease family protein [Planctomycetota bacterium]
MKKRPAPAAHSERPWFVYLLRCGDASLYCGATPDLAARLATHRAGKGARYTRARLPLRLVYSECCKSRGAALRREAEIKRWPRARKLELARRRRGRSGRGRGGALGR